MLRLQATVLIETLPAAFEMDEILFELREHSAGLNCGRWDYIFSFIKTLRADPKAVMPDRYASTLSHPDTAVPDVTAVLSYTADSLSLVESLSSIYVCCLFFDSRRQLLMCSSALVCSLVYTCVAQRCVSLQSRRVEQLHQKHLL